MGYATFPFVFLHLTGSIRLYLKLYLCLHIIGFITIFILPIFIRGEKKKQEEERQIKELQSNGIKVKENVDIFKCLETKHHDEKEEEDKKKERKHKLSNEGESDEHIIAQPQKQQPHIDTRTPPTKPKVLPDDPMRLKKDDCEMDKLSNIVREKIEIEKKNIEEFFDNTVTETISNIAEFKNDLMRKNNGTDEFISIRKRTTNNQKAESVDAFLKKEIESLNAAVQQTNVIPVVLGNGHAK